MRGGSLMRMNDGEQLMMHPDYNAPLTRLTDTMLRLQFASKAVCPGLCVGLLDPDNEDAILSIGQRHHSWWVSRGFRLTRSVFEVGLFSPNRTYCFGLATYRPKTGPGAMSKAEFAHSWDLVFANRSVMLVLPS